MSTEPPIVLITPEAKTGLEAEVERTGVSSDLVGGLLFGHPLDERRRLVVSFVRPSPEVGFGQKDFSLDQSRTSQQLDHARKLSPEAHYCGVWYLHRTPDRELSDEEWVQAQSVLEDPDYRFQDLVCLVLCFYFGELTFHASSFTKYQAARGQLPEPTQLQLTTDSPPISTRPDPAHPPTSPQPTSTGWYKLPAVVERLRLEYERLAQKYHTEATVAPGENEEVTFRLTPREKLGKLTFYLACERGFPDKAPTAFLLAGGKKHPLFSPGMANWSAQQWLVEVADGLVEWLAWSLDQYVATAEEALNREDYQEADDLLTMVLSIEPRTPRAARLLARAQAALGKS